MRQLFQILLLFVLFSGIVTEVQGQVRIKDIVRFETGQQNSLLGYGLVVGLGGTGDRSTGRRGAIFTVQSISNMLERFGITVPKEYLRTRNVAAVMVTASMPAFGVAGTRFDVTVSSLGDATSLEGGVLLSTPLMDPMGNHYAMAQGPLSVGGFNIETAAGERVRKNHALVGRVPDGGYLTASPSGQGIDPQKPVNLFLLEPDFNTASRIADKINTAFANTEGDKNYAALLGPGQIQLSFPDSIENLSAAISFIAAIETLSVQADVEARVVINERTGTIVAGGDVTIGEVMISHGNLTIHTRSAPIISQPGPFAYSPGARTVVERVTETQVRETESQTAVIQETTTVSELALALNTLGLKPRDVIAIFQAIKQAGALRAKLIIN
ncbi:MAG TPA: flagellar basal body P-ring protein FlgI [Caldithrix abyssi]|uniref:Flagellar P-ring protein n=1 Tax=Caldithrix abyssi TaxID=187145 RepID=A0A7V4U0R2_CALAY|nr:flagellar basal body P-ring protein FlgI [Caldithrix abyssi]